MHVDNRPQYDASGTPPARRVADERDSEPAGNDAAVTFRDASSLPFPPTFPFDSAVLDTLPTFDGVARVAAADSMAPIPEPSALWLWALGVLGVFALRPNGHAM